VDLYCGMQNRKRKLKVNGSKHAASPPASREKGVALALSWHSPREMHSPRLGFLNAISTCQIAYSAKDVQTETQHPLPGLIQIRPYCP
jgi:hypothetical protein